MNRLLASFIAAIGLFCSSLVSANTYYISASAGNDANIGSDSAPWATITWGTETNCLRPNDWLCIAPGTYNEMVDGIGGTGSMFTSPLRLTSWTSDTTHPVIDGGGVRNYCVYFSNQSMELVDIDLTNATVANYYVNAAPGNYIEDCTMATAVRALYVYGSDFCSATGIVMSAGTYGFVTGNGTDGFVGDNLNFTITVAGGNGVYNSASGLNTTNTLKNSRVKISVNSQMTRNIGGGMTYSGCYLQGVGTTVGNAVQDNSTTNFDSTIIEMPIGMNAAVQSIVNTTNTINIRDCLIFGSKIGVYTTKEQAAPLRIGNTGFWSCSTAVWCITTDAPQVYTSNLSFWNVATSIYGGPQYVNYGGHVYTDPAFTTQTGDTWNYGSWWNSGTANALFKSPLAWGQLAWTGNHIGPKTLAGAFSPTPVPPATPTPPASPTPTANPTATPTANPTCSPTPTVNPSPTPTAEPTKTPTPEPTPTSTPTAEPTKTPSPEPTKTPTPEPTKTPTPQPTASPTPSAVPTCSPSPTAQPTASPVVSPTPSPVPTAVPPTPTPNPSPTPPPYDFRVIPMNTRYVVGLEFLEYKTVPHSLRYHIRKSGK